MKTVFINCVYLSPFSLKKIVLHMPRQSPGYSKCLGLIHYFVCQIIWHLLRNDKWHPPVWHCLFNRFISRGLSWSGTWKPSRCELPWTLEFIITRPLRSFNLSMPPEIYWMQRFQQLNLMNIWLRYF